MPIVMTGIEKTIDKILDTKYRESQKILRVSKTSQNLLEELQKDCQHAPEKEIISLFKSVAAGTKMVDSAIIAAAHNIEYNCTHPSPSGATWLDPLFTDEARKLITPKQLMSRRKLYEDFVAFLSALESKYDEVNDPPDVAILRRQVTKFLKERVKKPPTKKTAARKRTGEPAEKKKGAGKARKAEKRAPSKSRNKTPKKKPAKKAAKVPKKSKAASKKKKSG
jgi:hypothetical protein